MRVLIMFTVLLLTALAGCTTGDETGGTPTQTPTTEPTMTATETSEPEPPEELNIVFNPPYPYINSPIRFRLDGDHGLECPVAWAISSYHVSDQEDDDYSDNTPVYEVEGRGDPVQTTFNFVYPGGYGILMEVGCEDAAQTLAAGATSILGQSRQVVFNTAIQANVNIMVEEGNTSDEEEEEEEEEEEDPCVAAANREWWGHQLLLGDGCDV